MVFNATKYSVSINDSTHHVLKGMTTVGFRFFTVYGPWGRPDMAANIFVSKILHNETITIYKNNGKDLLRVRT